MKTHEYILVIFGVLIAVFAGGCGLFFFGSAILALLQNEVDYGISVISVVIGILPGALGGLMAWWIYRRAKRRSAAD